jgi:hypothetical protein
VVVTSPTHPSERARGTEELVDLTAPRAGHTPPHEVTIVDGRFTIATCSCGWSGTARRHRAAARVEARDHALLYAEARMLTPHESARTPVDLADVNLSDIDVADIDLSQADPERVDRVAPTA